MFCQPNALILNAPRTIKICILKIFALPRIPKLYLLSVKTFSTGINFYLFKVYYKITSGQIICAKENGTAQTSKDPGECNRGVVEPR